jgi:hypothetical protein
MKPRGDRFQCYVLQLVVDVLAFDSPEVVDKLFLNKVRKNEMDPKDPGCGHRFVLPLPKDKQVRNKQVHSHVCV